MKTNILGAAFAVTIFTTGLGCNTPPQTGWTDADGDGYGDPSLPLGVVDAYGPGIANNNADCNDGDASIKPSANEIFDNIDNNCDGEVDNVPSWYADSDFDGFGNPNQSVQQAIPPFGYIADNTDCDDSNALINPNAPEIGGDDIDSNCNGFNDDVSVGTVGPAGGIIFHVEDTFALEAATSDQGLIRWGCETTSIAGGKAEAVGAGEQNTKDMAASGCSFVGQDINNLERDGFDDWHLPSIKALKSMYKQRKSIGNFAQSVLLQNVCYWSSTEDDFYANAKSVSWTGIGISSPGSVANLNKTAACYVRAVRTVHFEWFIDADNDGYGEESTKIIQVGQPEGYVSNSLDCNDTNPAINPAANELSDGIDNDCDGPIDELYDIGDTGPAGGTVFYVDASGAHGLEASPVDQDRHLTLGDGAEWGCKNFMIDGADGFSIGTGAQNTADMLAAQCQLHKPTNMLAVDLVNDYSLNGYSDWFIPSIEELQALYDAKDRMPGLLSNHYWSSTESELRQVEGQAPEAMVYYIVFENSLQPNLVGTPRSQWKGSSTTGLRAVRAF